MEKCHNSVILSTRKREKSTYKKIKRRLSLRVVTHFTTQTGSIPNQTQTFFFQYTVHKTKNNSRGENLTTIQTDRDYLADKRRVVLGRRQSSKRPAHVVTCNQNHMGDFLLLFKLYICFGGSWLAFDKVSLVGTSFTFAILLSQLLKQQDHGR